MIEAYVGYLIGLAVGVLTYRYSFGLPKEELLKQRISKLEVKNFKLARQIINKGMKNENKTKP